MRPAAALALVAALATGCTASSDRKPADGRPPTPPAAAAVARTPMDAAPSDVSPAADPITTRPAPRNHCAGRASGRRVLISIRDQRAWLCAGHRLALSTAVTTGASARRGDATPLGTFRIQGFDRATILHPADGGSYQVKYWIPFQAPLYGFHDAQWQRIPFGSPSYVTGGSDGCIHLPLRAMRFLFHWARMGTPVTIRRW